MKLDMNLLTLTIEQQFQMKLIEYSVEQMSQEQMKELLIESSRLLMIKDNAIKDLLENEIFPIRQ
jgi:uncharacterized protein YaaW (UPF0174 family)